MHAADTEPISSGVNRSCGTVLSAETQTPSRQTQERGQRSQWLSLCKVCHIYTLNDIAKGIRVSQRGLSHTEAHFGQITGI